MVACGQADTNPVAQLPSSDSVANEVAPRDEIGVPPRLSGTAAKRCEAVAKTRDGVVAAVATARADEVQMWRDGWAAGQGVDYRALGQTDKLNAVAARATAEPVTVCVIETPEPIPVPQKPTLDGKTSWQYHFARFYFWADGSFDFEAASLEPLSVPST